MNKQTVKCIYIYIHTYIYYRCVCNMMQQNPVIWGTGLSGPCMEGDDLLGIQSSEVETLALRV